MNTIGIDNNLDMPRIKHLLKLGLIAALIATAGDLILGYGQYDSDASGLAGYFSLYAGISDTRLFLSALLGMLGMSLEILCLFAVYRLMADCSPKLAHSYRAGILGCVMFGPCGYHVAFVAMFYFYKKVNEAIGVEKALELIQPFMMFFVFPAVILFFLFYIVLNVTQIKAFAGGYTPLTKKCFLFAPAIAALVIYVVCSMFKGFPVMNALATAWCHLGFLWMYLSLMVHVRKIDSKQR